jgi:hypothetical protein
MAWRAKVLLAAILAVFTVVANSACSSALAQTEEELAAGFTADNPAFIADLYLPDGGYTCQQINITGNDCHDPNGFPVACCFYLATPSPSQLQGPGCTEFGPSIVMIQQVGKGFCCARFAFGYGPTDWVRWEDFDKACDFCGGKTPKEDECCTAERDVVKKYPIQNLDDCPGRAQFKPPAHTTPPCGPVKAGPVKRAVIPQRYGPVTFEASCIVHDECYSTCRRDKGLCDLEIRELLRTACQGYFGPRIEAFKRAGADGTARVANTQLQNCVDMAEDFYGAVSDLGQEAYEAAQKDFCKCCE